MIPKLSQADIICKVCGKPAKINKIDGELCINCWREARKTKREKKQQDSLDHCLLYFNNTKFSEQEIRLIKDATSEINKERK